MSTATTKAFPDFGEVLARHQRAVVHHLCKELERSGHPMDVQTAHWVERLDGALALQVFGALYSPHLRRGALDALRHIQLAQRRLECGIYEICDECGAMLPTLWLRKHPAALRCPLCLASSQRSAL